MGCGIPYLTYHHFDPPWNVKNHHNPDGMIALCVLHASLADGGSYTKNQLLEMKKKPYLRGEISSFYQYLRDNAIADIGAYGIVVNDILVIDEERVIGFEKDESGFTRLNLLLRDSDGNIILEMKKNDWTVYSRELFDFECSTRGKKLRIVSGDMKTNLSMSFDDYSLETFEESLRRNSHDLNQIAYIMSKISNLDSVSVWKIRGSLLYGWKHLMIDDNLITLQDKNSNSTIRGISFSNYNRPLIRISNNMLLLH